MAPSKDSEHRRKRSERRDKAAHTDDASGDDRTYQVQKYRPSQASLKAAEHIYNININHGPKESRVTSSSSLSTSASPVIATKQILRQKETKHRSRYRSDAPESGSESESQHDGAGARKKSRHTPSQQPAITSKKLATPLRKARKGMKYVNGRSQDEEEEEEEEEASETEEEDRESDSDGESTDLEEVSSHEHQEQSDGDESVNDFDILDVEVRGNRNKKIPVKANLDTGTDSNWVSEAFREQLDIHRQKLNEDESQLRWQSFDGKEFGAHGKIKLEIMCDDFDGFQTRTETFFVTKKNSGFQMLIGKKMIKAENIYRRNRRTPQGDSAYTGIQSKPGKAEKQKIEQRRNETDAEAERLRAKRRAARKAEESRKAQNQNAQPKPKLALFARSKQKTTDKPRRRKEKDVEKPVKSSRSKVIEQEVPTKASRPTNKSRNENEGRKASEARKAKILKRVGKVLYEVALEQESNDSDSDDYS